MSVASERHEARLARSVIEGGRDASRSAMTLLEHAEPPTLTAAVALIAAFGTVTPDVFDRVADAWETYRHVKHFSWD